MKQLLFRATVWLLATVTLAACKNEDYPVYYY